jgi:hypothetical protein
LRAKAAPIPLEAPVMATTVLGASVMPTYLIRHGVGVAR